MTVYELIQELAQFKPDTKVNFHTKGKMDVDTTATFDRENEDDEQNVVVEVEIDEYFEFDDITDNERSRIVPSITINLEY